MIESKRTLIIIAGITCLLILTIMLLHLFPPYKYEPTQDEISIFDYKTEEISRVVLQRGGESIELLQDESGWISGGARLEYERADLIVTLLAYLYSDNHVGSVNNLTEYGLEQPNAKAEFYAKDKSHRVDFGLTSADGKSVYMRVDGEAEVYTMPIEAYDILFCLF